MSRTKFQTGQFDLFNYTPKKVITDGMSLPSDATSGPNCGLTAIAIAAGCTMADAISSYTKYCPKRGNWKGGTLKFFRAKALADLGVETKKIEGLDGYTFIPRTSLKQFCQRHAVDGKRYIITTTGHVQIVRGNEVIDQQGKMSIKEYWGSRKRIKEILEIIE
tara:strand:+ start:107 stop:595 length:489 start_codon:yes stop_codon:yes gene_type:complete